MQLVDLLFLIVIFFSAWSGWRSGFIFDSIGLILWVGSLAAAFCLYPYAVRPLINLAPGLGVWLNKLLGIFPGLINEMVAAAVIALLFMALPLSDRLSEQLRRSQLADDLTMPAEWVEERLSPVFERPVERTIGRLSADTAYHRGGIGII